MGNVTWKQVAVITAIIALLGLLGSGRERDLDPIDSWYMPKPKLFGATNVR